MPVIRFTKVAVDIFLIGGELPFRFAWQARTGPLGVSVSLVVTDMGYRRLQIELALAAERKFGIKPFGPVKRPGPIFPVDDRPAIGMPELGFRVCAVADKVEILVIVDKARADLVLCN